MGIHFRSRAGAGPEAASCQPQRLWRTSAERSSRADTAPRLRALLAALVVVGRIYCSTNWEAKQPTRWRFLTVDPPSGYLV